MQLDSRPSDAIALAIRAKAPVLVEDRVFDKSEPSAGRAPGAADLADDARRRPRAPVRRRTAGDLDSQQWAIQRRIDDIFAKLGEKFGDLTGRVEVQIKPETIVRPDRRACARPRASCGASPPRSPTPSSTASGASRRPRACCSTARPAPASRCSPARSPPRRARSSTTSSSMNLTSKFGPNTGELLQEILDRREGAGQGRWSSSTRPTRSSLEHLLPPAQAREAVARLVAALCEKLDALDDFSRMRRRRRPRAAPTRSTPRWSPRAVSIASSR